MSGTPLTGEEVGIADAPFVETPQNEVADAEQQPEVEVPEFKYELATGQKYRDEQALIEAQEHATRHIFEQSQQIKAYEAALQAVRQPAEPPPDPYADRIKAVATSLYNDGGIEWNTAVALAKSQVEQAAPIQEAMQNLVRQQMRSEYEAVRSQDPAFDWDTENPVHREIIRTITTAYPNEGPRQHYSRFVAMTGRDPVHGAQVRQTVQTQIAQRQRAFGSPANGAAPAPQQDAQNVQAAVDSYIQMRTAQGIDPAKITPAEIESVKTRARNGNR